VVVPNVGLLPTPVVEKVKDKKDKKREKKDKDRKGAEGGKPVHADASSELSPSYGMVGFFGCSWDAQEVELAYGKNSPTTEL